MSIDAIIIADCKLDESRWDFNFQLRVEKRVGSIQNIFDYVKNTGTFLTDKRTDTYYSWAGAANLNGMYLYNYLFHQNISVRLIDNFDKDNHLFKQYLNENPRFAIISTTFISNKGILKNLIKQIRDLAPDLFIIVGGPLVFSSYQVLQKKYNNPLYDVDSPKIDYLFLETENDPLADLYIISQCGLITLGEVLHRLKQNKSITDIQNLAFFDGKKYTFTKQIDDTNYKEIIKLDWNCMPEFVFERGIVPLYSGIGCTYNCYFCTHNPDITLRYAKPIDQVISELKVIAERGIRYVRFSDNNLRFGSNDINQFCKRLAEENLNIKWYAYLSVNRIKTLDLDILKKSGCTHIFLGLESGSEKILKAMNKKGQLSSYLPVVKSLLDHGINCNGNFIVGYPGETKDTLKDTRELISQMGDLQTNAIFTWALALMVFKPLSPIYEPELKKQFDLEGYFLKWKHYTMDNNIAQKHMIKTVFQVENTGWLYNEDNLDINSSLPIAELKRFQLARQRLVKQSITSPITKNDIMEAFSDIYQANKSVLDKSQTLSRKDAKACI